MKTASKNKISDSFLMSMPELWEQLRISKNHFHKLKSAGKIGPIPIRTLGSRVLWSRKEVGEWVDAGCPNREQWQKMRAEKN